MSGRLMIGLVLGMLAFGRASLGVDTTAATSADTKSFLTDHLEIGTRITYFRLLNENDKSFLGSIDHLGDSQDYNPSKVFVDWLFCPYGGLELTWDRIEAVATTSTSDNHTDGKFLLDGPILTAFARYPNKSILTPYAGVGVAYYHTDFEAQDWWAQGFASPQDFVDFGKPSTDRNNKGRAISTDTTAGFVATAGTAIKITKNWSADLYFRYSSINLDAHFMLTTDGQVSDDKGHYGIPFDNVTGGVGVKYVF